MSQSLDLEHAELLCSGTNEEEPLRRDKRWFCDTYCGGYGLERGAAESVWDLVTTPTPTEVIAMIACVPALIQRFCVPEATYIAHPPARDGTAPGAVEHRVIGGTSTALSAPALNEFLQETLRTGVRLILDASNNRVFHSHTKMINCQVQASRMKSTAPPLIVITDAGQDLDDEVREPERIILHLEPRFNGAWCVCGHTDGDGFDTITTRERPRPVQRRSCHPCAISRTSSTCPRNPQRAWAWTSACRNRDRRGLHEIHCIIRRNVP